jgi:hypothetical protein
MTTTRSYSLDINIVEGIKSLARELDKKQSQILTEAFVAYKQVIEADDELSADLVQRIKRDSDAIKRGERTLLTLAEVKNAA